MHRNKWINKTKNKKLKIKLQITRKNVPGIRLVCNVRYKYGHAVRSHDIFVITRTC